MKLYWCILLISGLLPLQESISGGLKFKGSEHSIEDRTSYNVFKNKNVTFTNKLEIEFDIELFQTIRNGYIVRIKSMSDNRIFNLYYMLDHGYLSFRLNEEGNKNLITANVSRTTLTNEQWFKIRILFDLQKDSIRLDVHNNTSETVNIKLPDRFSPDITFGRSDFIIDVPTFAIKNLSVGSKDKYFFPLIENEGNIVHDNKGKSFGNVSNPEWLINDAYHWKHLATFKSSSIAGTNYNKERNEIYYYNKDTLFIYNVESGDKQVKIFEEQCPVKFITGTNFLDIDNNKLYAYEVYYSFPYKGYSIASLDLNTYKWRGESKDLLSAESHHHGSYFNSRTNTYTIFGGFRRNYYSKSFFSYDIDGHNWQKIEKLSGDEISPRYFSSVGFIEKENRVLVFGGMGNESGDPTIGRKYYYDLYQVDLKSNQISKQWEILWGNINVVPVEEMIISDTTCFYTLCYPEHISESYLQLYRFSLSNGDYEVLGDSIPIVSDKITTKAHLYSNRQSNKLYALVKESPDDISSTLHVYSLDFPPITHERLYSFTKGASTDTTPFMAIIYLILIVLGLSAIVVMRIRKSKNKKIENKNLIAKVTKTNPKPNSIYLFGDFLVHDRNNKDITYMFSARLKEIFCLILRHNDSGGITSKNLSDELWPDKINDKVKNVRGITINRLRKALGELDGIELIYEKGCFKLVQTDLFYCDYSHCLEIISSNKVGEKQMELLNIVSRGKFLLLADTPIFDAFKQEVESKLEPVLLIATENAYNSEAYQTTIDFSDIIFNIDPLNETALKFQIKALNKLKMYEEAQIKYKAFTSEYKKVMGNNYHDYQLRYP